MPVGGGPSVPMPIGAKVKVSQAPSVAEPGPLVRAWACSAAPLKETRVRAGPTVLSLSTTRSPSIQVRSAAPAPRITPFCWSAPKKFPAGSTSWTSSGLLMPRFSNVAAPAGVTE